MCNCRCGSRMSGVPFRWTITRLWTSTSCISKPIQSKILSPYPRPVTSVVGFLGSATTPQPLTSLHAPKEATPGGATNGCDSSEVGCRHGDGLQGADCRRVNECLARYCRRQRGSSGHWLWENRTDLEDCLWQPFWGPQTPPLRQEPKRAGRCGTLKINTTVRTRLMNRAVR